MELDPAETVRAVYEAIVRGEDASQFAEGRLRDYLKIDSASTAHVEATAQEVEFRRLDVVERSTGQAIAWIDGAFRLAARYPDGEWAAQVQTFQGPATLKRRGGVWRVVDLPESGGSLVDSLATVTEREQHGDLELAVAYRRSARIDTCVVVVRNVGTVPLGGEQLFSQTTYARLPIRGRFPSPHQGQLMPGQARGERHLFRSVRGRTFTVLAEARDGEGRAHTSRVELSLPPISLRQRLRVRFTVTRLLEAIAVLTVILGALSQVNIPLFYPGILFLIVGMQRLAGLTSFIRRGGRGKGIAPAGVIATAEFVGGATLALSNSAWAALPVLATAAFYIWQSGIHTKVQWNPAK